MSGVEIAGLLLATFPLLISALENYRETAEVLEDWWRIKKEYKKCKNEIKIQELAFESNLERFLLPLVVGDDEIDALIADPGGTRWKDSTLEDKLRSRLPKAYELFLETVYEIHAVMEGLRDELGLDRVEFQRGLQPNNADTKSPRPRSPLRSLIKRDKLVSQKPVPKLGNLSKSWKKWLGRSNIEYQTQRIKFGFGRTDRTKLFEEFGRLNGRLRELLDTSDQSTALKQSREQMKNSMIAKAVCRVWRHATSLHELLEQAWCCQCKHMHRVHLLLRHETNLERIEYSVCLMYTVNMFPSSPWNCVEVTAQRMEIKTLDVPQLEEPRSGSSTSISSQPVSKSASKDSQPSPKPALRSPRTSQLSSRRKVNWTDSSVASAAISTDQKSSTPVIKNLCSSIAACEDKNTCLGMLKGDEESYLLQHDQRREDMQDSISLESLLQGKSDMRLDRRQRYTIAFMLVSSHLQLYPSPWLSSQWTKKDILFVKDADNPGSVKVEQPYMRRDAVSVPRSTTSSYASRDRLLPTLGILLIELCFGTALENHEMRKHCQSVASAGGTSPDLLAALDLGIALEWSRLVGGEAGERYADAVQWCLKGQVPVAKDDKWREELYANVVLPVRFCYEQFRPQAMQT